MEDIPDENRVEEDDNQDKDIGKYPDCQSPNPDSLGSEDPDINDRLIECYVELK